MSPEEQARIAAVTSKLTGEEYLVYGTRTDGSVGPHDDLGDTYAPYYAIGALTGTQYGPFMFLRDVLEECIRREAAHA